MHKTTNYKNLGVYTGLLTLYIYHIWLQRILLWTEYEKVFPCNLIISVKNIYLSYPIPKKHHSALNIFILITWLIFCRLPFQQKKETQGYILCKILWWWGDAQYIPLPKHQAWLIRYTHVKGSVWPDIFFGVFFCRKLYSLSLNLKK